MRAARSALRLRAARAATVLGPGHRRGRYHARAGAALFEEAAGTPMVGIVGTSDPYEAVREELERCDFDEVILSTLPERISRRLHRDLPNCVEQLGVPVTVLTAVSRSPPDSR
jgi:hypothetical protein